MHNGGVNININIYPMYLQLLWKQQFHLPRLWLKPWGKVNLYSKISEHFACLGASIEGKKAKYEDEGTETHQRDGVGNHLNFPLCDIMSFKW